MTQAPPNDHTIKQSLKSPTDSVIPHPALDVDLLTDFEQGGGNNVTGLQFSSFTCVHAEFAQHTDATTVLESLFAPSIRPDARLSCPGRPRK